VPPSAYWQDRFGPYVLTVGGIEPRKGSLDLLEAYALLKEPGLRLVIGGGETLFDYRDYRSAWTARAAELGAEPVVLGPVPHDDLPGLVASAAVFAFPSVKEGFGLAAMEALAAGVPLVTRDLPVLREVFGTTALFAADPQGFATQISAALATPDPVRRDAGRALADRHSWATSAADHVAFYESIQPVRGSLT
jgi:glycosyltransferase involved in cell wall biosynthesis